jgi:hypothetical protein
MLFSFPRFFGVFFCFVAWAVALLFFFCLFKKINVLQVCWLCKKHDKKIRGQHRKGLCAAGWLKPKPCLWVGSSWLCSSADVYILSPGFVLKLVD